MNDLLHVAKSAALAAGEEIMRLYEITAFEKKDDGSPLTTADKNANTILIEFLSKTGIAILSEEGQGLELPYPEYLWVIDPLDGTRDFINKTGDFAVMIGLLHNNGPVLGVVYAPHSKKLYYALKGDGAFLTLNGKTKRLDVQDVQKEALRCIRSVNHFTSRMKLVMEKLEAISIPHGSIGIKTGLVAENAGDFFFSWGNLGEWDVCGPEIILTEAGGKVSDVDGAPLVYGTSDHRIKNGMLFTNGHCHEKVLAVLGSTPPEKLA